MNNLRIKLFLLMGVTAVAASCTEESAPVPSGPVSLQARIADETRATLNDDSGLFAFSSGDAIKVCNGSGIYLSTGVTVDGTSASFTMDAGFTDSGSGLAAYPAAIVSGITSSSVTFTLPTSYTYDQVGRTDPSTSQVPCPMIAAYTAGNDLVFKQAGAVVRFRVKECLGGTLTFTFKSQVTGTVTLTSVPTGTNDGILADNFKDKNGGYSITVTDVPEVTGDAYFYVTLPVPVGTDPINVSVWNDGYEAGKFKTLTGTPVSLQRAGGYKRGVTLQNRQSGGVTFGGLSIAGFLYNYNNTSYGILQSPFEVLMNYGRHFTDKQYYFCWNDIVQHIPGLFTSQGMQIGEHRYEVPSGGNYGQWKTIVGTDRAAAKVNGVNAHYAFVTVTDLATPTYPASSIRGLLLFPDNAIIALPEGASLSNFDSVSGNDNNTATLTALQSLEGNGCVFFPAAGYSDSANNDNWGDLNLGGYYWSRTNYTATYAYALSFTYDEITKKYTLAPKNSVDVKATAYFPICLIQCD